MPLMSISQTGAVGHVLRRTWGARVDAVAGVQGDVLGDELDHRGHVENEVVGALVPAPRCR